MKAWKCYNCQAKGTDINGFDFEAEKPICPKCGADGTGPRGHHAVQARVILHFDPPSPIVNVGQNVIACKPSIGIIGNKHGLRATGDTNVVTCEACKSTDAYKKAAGGGVDLSSAVTLPDDLE